MQKNLTLNLPNSHFTHSNKEKQSNAGYYDLITIERNLNLLVSDAKDGVMAFGKLNSIHQKKMLCKD